MDLSERALEVLRQIEIPRTRRPLGDLIEDLSIDGGSVHVRMRLAPAYASKSQLTSWVEQALKAIPGVERVQVEFVQTQRPRPRVLTQKVRFPQIARILVVFSGKGGVGKSTVSVNLAVALAQQGARVGLFDADVHGPNIPTLLGLTEPPVVKEGKLLPIFKHGVHAISIGLLVGGGDPLIWRGPMISKAIRELLESTAWPELDYLIVDMPPGTGDAQLGLAQDVELTGAIAVTTPQEVALSDVRRGIGAFFKLHVPVLGIIENMAYYLCPKCGHREYIFGQGGGEAEARRQKIPLLGQIPLDPKLREGGDAGMPIVIAHPSSPAAQEFGKIAERLMRYFALSQGEQQ
ncbi:MAG: Mrp/NBP35 family ATP-binding protein [Candidatus Bipolaricaulota bacterium]|nr:Mrp/NBP35 family ATP-binding protein [Candidatus Bipolaricaulota bacterium]MDW8031168.1 P-loop NTPase [Candidatus Bipolaricaulota bacterium]